MLRVSRFAVAIPIAFPPLDTVTCALDHTAIRLPLRRTKACVRMDRPPLSLQGRSALGVFEAGNRKAITVRQRGRKLGSPHPSPRDREPSVGVIRQNEVWVWRSRDALDFQLGLHVLVPRRQRLGLTLSSRRLRTPLALHADVTQGATIEAMIAGDGC